jgi:hypothetical protein
VIPVTGPREDGWCGFGAFQGRENARNTRLAAAVQALIKAKLAAVLNGWRFAGSDRIDEALPRGKEDVGADYV